MRTQILNNGTILKRKIRKVLFQSLILLLGVRLDPQELEMVQSTHGSITPPALHFPDTGVDW